MKLKVLEGLGEVDAAAWDALAGEDDPFVEHAFLRALETSGSVGPGSGWQPLHLSVWDEERLVAALPMYLKGHSYGEYIFDWAWAGAAERAGLDYYPKLVSMVPMTPATGRRFLLHPDGNAEELVPMLLEGALALADATEASSIHLLFLNAEERSLVRGDRRFLLRQTMQFHWRNEGYGEFDDFLGRFRSSMRKKLKKERRAVGDAGLELRILEGAQLGDAHWQLFQRYYEDTCSRKGSYPYLTPEFFEAGVGLKRAVGVFAYDGSRPVAGTLNFQKGAHLYGRYWGAEEQHKMLHFELCYYQLIERAIRMGVKRFEAGAQGTHKLRRGLMPAAIHSAHWIKHPGLRAAVADHIPREAFSVQMEMEELAKHGPFRRDQ